MKETVEVSNVFDTPSYKRSRTAYLLHCAFEYFIALLVSDAFLAKLLSNIGFSDTLIGIISSIISAAFLFQLSTIFLAQKIRTVKTFVITFSTLSQVLFVSIYLIPFLPFSKSLKSVMVVGFLLLAYLCLYSISPLLSRWGNSYVAPTNRGSYSAVKEMVSLISGMAFTLAMGFVIDYYEGIDNIRGGFLFVCIAGLIVSACSFTCLKNITKDVPSQTASTSLKVVFKNTLGNKNFIPLVILACIATTSSYMTLGFMGTFKTKDLLFSVGTVQVINIAANLLRFLISKPLGKFSDKFSFAKGLELGYFIAATAFAFNMFSSPSTRWCVVVYSILHAASAAGTGQNGMNIVYNYVNKDYYAEATALKNSISGIVGFLISLLASKILGMVQANGNMFLGIPMYGQQLLSAISMIFSLAAALYTRFVIGRQKAMLQ